MSVGSRKKLWSWFSKAEWSAYDRDTWFVIGASTDVARYTLVTTPNAVDVKVEAGESLQYKLSYAEILAAGIAFRVITTSSSFGFEPKLGFRFSEFLNRLAPEVKAALEYLLERQKKSSKSRIDKLYERINAHEAKSDRADNALVVIRQGEPIPELENLLHRKIRRELPADWCSWSRLNIRSELIPGFVVDVGQAIYAPTMIDAWCVIKVGGHERLFDAPKNKGLENAVELVTRAVITGLVEVAVRAQAPQVDLTTLRTLPPWVEEAVSSEMLLPKSKRKLGISTEDLAKLLSMIRRSPVLKPPRQPTEHLTTED